MTLEVYATRRGRFYYALRMTDYVLHISSYLSWRQLSFCNRPDSHKSTAKPNWYSPLSTANQNYTQSQRNSSPSVFSIKTGPSRTTRTSHWRLGLARGSVPDVTLSMLQLFIVTASVLSVFNVTKAKDENSREIPVKVSLYVLLRLLV